MPHLLRRAAIKSIIGDWMFRRSFILLREMCQSCIHRPIQIKKYVSSWLYFKVIIIIKLCCGFLRIFISWDRTPQRCRYRPTRYPYPREQRWNIQRSRIVNWPRLSRFNKFKLVAYPPYELTQLTHWNGKGTVCMSTYGLRRLRVT